MENEKRPQIVFNISGGTLNNVGSQITEQHNTFTGNDMKTQSVSTAAGREPSGDLSPALATPQAQALWQKAQEAGWVDKERQPTRKLETKTSRALFANIMANKLRIPSPMYEPFEKLWGDKELSKSYSAGNPYEKNQKIMDEIRDSLR